MNDMHMLTGAYAVGALVGAERDRFAEHLSSCGHCRDEVRELVETAALLGVAATETPPAGLRERVLTEVSRTRQVSPLVASLAEQAEVRRKALRGRRASMTVAACLAVFSIGLGAYATALTQENGDLRQQSEAIVALSTAPDARTITRGNDAGATGALTLSRATGQMLFMSAGLAELTADQTYQLWLLRDDGSARSMGIFDAGDDSARLLAGPGDARTVAVTVEPAGGSAQPTTLPVLSLPVPRAA